MREAAVGALLCTGTRIGSGAFRMLDGSGLQVQEAASAILASLADARVLMPLMQALGSRDWIVRMHAAKGLGRIGDAQAIPALMPLLAGQGQGGAGGGVQCIGEYRRSRCRRTGGGAAA